MEIIVNTTYLNARIDEIASNLDQFFLVLMGSIIFFMQCGFAFLECGSVRIGNASSILFKNIMDSVIGAICYWMVGYAFAYGEPSNFFLGYNYFFARNMAETTYAMWFFQFSFAATASTILSGAVAERMEMGSYLVSSVVITSWIYPVVTHWTWGGGWLAERGFQDFAGSCVVHMCGGTCALIGAAMLGPRRGRFDPQSQFGRAHSVPYVALGAFILFFGFLAFNGGSVGGITGGNSGATVARAMVITIIGGSVGALTTVITHRRYSVTLAVNGALTGMVAACGGCNVYALWAAVPLGVLASLMYSAISTLLDALHVDDPLDAVAVHFGGGLIGILFVPFFDITYGVVYYGTSKNAFDILKWNVAGAGAVFGWSAGISFLMFGAMSCFGVLRIDEEYETEGIDNTKHNEPAYPDFITAIRMQNHNNTGKVIPSPLMMSPAYAEMQVGNSSESSNDSPKESHIPSVQDPINLPNIPQLPMYRQMVSPLHRINAKVAAVYY